MLVEAPGVLTFGERGGNGVLEIAAHPRPADVSLPFTAAAKGAAARMTRQRMRVACPPVLLALA